MIHACAVAFRPRAIAIVGASDSTAPGNWSRVLDGNIAHTGVDVPVFPVNPQRREVWGRPCYPTLRDLPQPVDLALSVVPARFVPDVLRDALAAGVRGAIVYASGFGEGGGAGVALGDALRDIAAAGVRITGPNCMGSLALHERILLYPSNPPSRVRTLPAGDVGVIFQSGGTFQYWLQSAATRGLGFSYAVSSGSELDLDLADYLEFMLDDERTSLVCCMIEGIRRPAEFMAAAARALALGKPVLVVKIGTTERARTASAGHTGLLAGDDAVFDAMCERYGIVRCASLDEMVDVALVLRTKRRANGAGIAMVSYSGGGKGLFLDAAIGAGLTFADLEPATLAAVEALMDPGLAVENPLDAGAAVAYDAPRLVALTAAIANDPNVAILAVQGQLPVLPDDRTDPSRFAAMAAATAKPLLAFSRLSQNVDDVARAYQRGAGMPFVFGIPQTVRAMRAAVRYAARAREGVTPLAPFHGNPRHEHDVTAALAAAGVHGPREAFANNPADAAAAAAAIGFPVALKALAPKIVHKTEFGAVRLGLVDAGAVEDAARELTASLAARGVADVRFLIQPMVRGVEAVVGARNDAQFGPVLVLGLGGIFVELLHDVALRLLPAGPADVRAMIAELRGAALFDGFRGSAPADVDALVAAAVAIGEVFLDHRDVLSDLEVNPLIVHERGRGASAVDIRAILR